MITFEKPSCNWDCNRLTGNWCDGHKREVDFYGYISDKEFVISYYKQIKQHRKSIEFHPQSKENIEMMISALEKSIKSRLQSISNFRKRYEFI